MPLPDEIRALADGILRRLQESRDYYIHTQQAWRVVQQVVHEGRSVGIVDAASGAEIPATSLEPLAQRYVTGHLTGAVFRGLSGILEDWILGLARLWLTAYPVQLDAAYGEAAERSRSQRREEIQVPLSEILGAPDRDAIIGSVVERVVRELAYRRPSQWFQFLDHRVNLGCPDEARRGAICELKAARDAIEHNRGTAGRDYVEKSGRFARCREGEEIQLDEPYLMHCFGLLREVVEEMAASAIRRSGSGGVS
ncbi:hypothetical protein OJF2_36270 [Aquisphaera giovannonii]|uniref:RiboL-PSP-HEPN domain-containing protein n=1 Tax=Aquisphaera giovannonii TaxID=406548 RepID=A0A5B9W3B8_9BACT|nr:hypothetical protein [Aquisphaera giovannonii]QEH35082.1 hypothetical protein OJF2_36270 [Aquisphaera giovannonii]